MEQHCQPDSNPLKFSVLRKLWAESPLEELTKGRLLLKEGEQCKSLYLIVKGQLRSFYNKNGREINVNFSFEGQFVTNLKSYVHGSPSAYYIQAAENTLIRKLSKDRLAALQAEDQQLETFSCDLMQHLLIQQEEHSNLYKIYTPSERYFYMAKYHPILLQRVSLSQLSSYLGISRETISRIRKSTFNWADV